MDVLPNRADRTLLAHLARAVGNAFRPEEKSIAIDTSGGLEKWGRALLPDHFTMPSSAMHRWIFAQCERMKRERGLRVNVVGPRGGAKSTSGSLTFPLCQALEGAEPLIWLISETGDQAEAMLANIKEELESNERILRAYPHSAGRGRVWRDSKIVLRNGVAIQAYGVGMKIRGRRKGAKRPTLIIIDDVQSDKVMHSTNLRDRDWLWVNSSLLKAGTKRTNVINLATALHRDAIAMRWTRTPGWESQTFSAIKRWPDNMGLWAEWESIYHDIEDQNCVARSREFFQQHEAKMKAGAKLLWPEEEDLLTLMELRAREGHGPFEREKQSRTVNPDTCEWPEELLDDRIFFDDWPERWSIRTMALDPSKGKSDRRGDYSSFAMLQKTGDVYYLDADLARRPVGQIVDDGVVLWQRFRPDAFGIEANQFQELLAGQFDSAFEKLGLAPAIHLVFNQTNKRVRIRSTLGPLLSQRRLKIRRTAGGLLLLSQLRDFPDPQAHDDGPDSGEMAVRLAADLLTSVADTDDHERIH